jgi:hypothetical protein
MKTRLTDLLTALAILIIGVGLIHGDWGPEWTEGERDG